ncbi:MAG: CehA/McbA family metallohydrolase [Candidatus Bathyarchaeota archaeon]|nr:MAG: CehA/McbA family metallohydrolase [Candidatus Bathyarchaeota archaeon]
MRLRLDLHIHTIKSIDSSIELGDAVRRCREEGLDGFAVTDHDELTKIPSEFSENSNIIIIPGMEASADGAHILAFDIEEQIPAQLPILETVDLIHGQGGIAVIAHPYSVFKAWVNSREIEQSKFDCVEVANAAQFPYGWMLSKNTALAQKLGLPETGGSDAHIPRTMGRAYTVLESDSRDREGVLRALRRGETSAEGRGITLLERLKLRERLT